MNKELPNPIRNFFEEREAGQKSLTSRQLFSADSKDVDLKTDLNKQEIDVINKMLWLDRILLKTNMKPIYTDYLQEYMRLNISLDRKSRGEFVSVNKQSDINDDVDKLSSLKGLIR